jgi:hypothetical protein
MKKVIPLIVSLALLGACGKFEPDDGKLITEAKAAIVAELADPASAQFRSVRAAPEAKDRLNGTVCGEILGKFDYGQQGKYRTFIYVKTAEFAGIAVAAVPGEEMLPETAEYKRQYDDIWKNSCAAG